MKSRAVPLFDFIKPECLHFMQGRPEARRKIRIIFEHFNKYSAARKLFLLEKRTNLPDKGFVAAGGLAKSFLYDIPFFISGNGKSITAFFLVAPNGKGIAIGIPGSKCIIHKLKQNMC